MKMNKHREQELLEIIEQLLIAHNSDEYKHIRPMLNKVLNHFNNLYADEITKK
jgi:hypothetical protein